MTTEILLLKFCALSLVLLWLLALIRGSRECTGMFRRWHRGEGFRPDLWLLLPFLLALVLAATWIGGIFWLPKGLTSTFNLADAFGDSDVFFLDVFVLVRDSATWIWGPALILLIAIPIAHAFRNRDFYWHLYVMGVLGLLAMPIGLIALGTFVERETTVFERGDPNFRADPASAFGNFGRYGLKDETPNCTWMMMGALHLKTFGHDGYSPERDRAVQLTQLWLNNTYNVATLDVPSAFGCEVSQIEPNPNYLPTAVTLGFYRAFVALVLLGMIARPFVRV
ncbi:MAG: hypothetical protein JSR60_03690 [Proteobacteria bacterium]|nr:hypothetical protein [Pseudomonadota bacterium]